MSNCIPYSKYLQTQIDKLYWKGASSTATTYLKRHKISKGDSIAKSLKDRFDYGMNPDKTQEGELISSYECDHMTADVEFLLSKAKYRAITGREQRGESDVLCYQIRQSFKPGEITPEEANRIGYETAMRWTKGKYAFFVATHTDKKHIHNHIYYNSTSLDCTHKFRDFIGSARALRRLSDQICMENALSVITAPKLHSQGQYAHYGAWVKRKREGLIVDIQEKLAAGKGPAYERWAKLYNLKQMASALMFLQEKGISQYAELDKLSESLVDSYHDIGSKLRQTEAELDKTTKLMAAVVDYAKLRPVFESYKATKYSRKYLAEHDTELTDFRATQAAMREILNGEKLPSMEELKEKRRRLAADKKRLYAEFRQAQNDMREAIAVKANIDHLLGNAADDRNKEQER